MSLTKRKNFNIEVKSRIISNLESGTPNNVLAKKYGVPHSTISTIWKQREKIRKLFGSNFLKMKRARTSKHTKIEEALLEWFEYQRANNLPINGPILQQKANYFARYFGEDFICSSSWIQRFRVRHGIIGGKSPSPQNRLKAYSSNNLKERIPSPEIKLERIREKENDKCCCCLREDGDGWLWSSEENSGDNNVYGKLLEECFNITIGTQMLSDHRICKKCKEQLKQALQFKRQVLECQQRLTESWTTGSELPDSDIADESPLAALKTNKAGIAPGVYDNYNQDGNVDYVETELLIEIKEEPLPEEDPDPLNVELELFVEPKEEIESVVSTADESRINEDTAIPDCNKLNTNTVKNSAVKQMDEEMLPQANIMQDVSRRGQHMLQSFNEQMPEGKPNSQLKTVRKAKRPHTETVPKKNKVPKLNKRAGLSSDSFC